MRSSQPICIYMVTRVFCLFVCVNVCKRACVYVRAHVSVRVCVHVGWKSISETHIVRS